MAVLKTNRIFQNHAQLQQLPQKWIFFSIHRFIQQKIYPLDWGGNGKV
ncbi:hypothetical protein I8748_10980 [Nostoc sp. CENA67]|uniref:Uncharacterized protein n=1 Tax=Amazonocrinis nigriterrae CENA67 TaxID=2794033 RepID=A0A8J7HRH1_9NOST|nr:hypothetical protein [Amazonocrinis nigriterrae]MBH8562695.1 hypothetical protein [Amazonocrinis nigriterrae CENA67]